MFVIGDAEVALFVAAALIVTLYAHLPPPHDPLGYAPRQMWTEIG